MLQVYLSGAITMAYLAVGLFFVRFWRKTHDRLFFMFAGAFWLLAAERIILVWLEQMNEFTPFVYMLRLASFVLIAIAVVDKNKARPAR